MLQIVIASKTPACRRAGSQSHFIGSPRYPDSWVSFQLRSL